MSEPIAWPDDDVILYDGVCVFCSGWVRFVAGHDPSGRFRFTPIQSDYGRALAEAAGIDPDDPDTNAVVIGGTVLRRSDAALAVIGSLPGWRWARVGQWAPRWLRDGVYTLIARNRYRLFGRRDACVVGGPRLDGRVLTEV
ncbi:thiol-disulfide oxidoreductase DCC family protein [Bauldia sp.]|uniref:thiol-disulfide oxidoreductase DCC family protein n=1 Tax=Bauldia sp. TaxID=2575872 RepID=UPI003BA9C8F9